MNRLKCISSYISDNEKVLDVGCDQALLSKLLARRGVYSIASDIKANIIINAKKNLSDLEKKYITFTLSDGVPEGVNQTITLVLSGMGTYTILDILKNSKVFFNKIITISNNNHDILRSEMNFFISNDYLQCNVLDFTKLGLLEITRKKGQKALKDIFTENI